MTDIPPLEETDERPKFWSAEAVPYWFNPATIKGAIAIALGLFFLMFPQASLPLIRYGLGGGLVFFGASDLWSFFAGHDQTERGNRLFGSLLAIAAGILIIFWPQQTFRLLEIVLGAYLALQGINILVRTWQTRGEEGIGWPILRGIVYLFLGAAMFLVGEFLIATFLVVVAVAAIAFGLVAVGVGIDARPEEAAALNTDGILAIVVAWLNQRDLGPEKRTEVADTLYFEQPDELHKIVSYTVMLLLSVVIATLAILADSTAVVIGAMLIAPLMTPIMGTAAAIVNGWRMRMVWSLVVVAASVAGAIATAWFVATWAPALVPAADNTQILSRTSPTLLDLGIALAAGAAGAYATVDDRVSSSLPGVAIAVALVPPLGVVGVTLTLGLYDDALGAFLLFSTNFVSIILASSVVFVATGFSPVQRFVESRRETVNVLGTIIVGALLIMIPLGITSSSILETASNQEKAHKVATEWLEDYPYLDLGPVEVDGTTIEVNVSGPDPLPGVGELEAALTAEFGEPVTVEVEHFKTVRITAP